MRTFLLAGAAVFAFTAAPSLLLAQDVEPTLQPVPAPDGTTTVTRTETTVTSSPQATKGTTGTKTMTVQQKTVYATWEPTRQSDYGAWPVGQQTYYWTLTPEQQKGYWSLSTDERGRIYRMTPEQRALALQSVVQQLRGQQPSTPPGQANPPGSGLPTAGVPNPQTANQATQPAMPADEGYQGGPYKGALTPPPADAMSKTYPVCSRTVSDRCRNRDTR